MWAIWGSVGFPAFCANAPLVERHTAAIAAIRRTDIKNPPLAPADCVRRAFTEVDICLDESGCQEVPDFFVVFNAVLSCWRRKTGTQWMSASGSLADIQPCLSDVRFTPKSRHSLPRPPF